MIKKFLTKTTLLTKILTFGCLALCMYGGYLFVNKLRSIPKYNKVEPIPVTTTKIGKRFLMTRELFPARLEADDSVLITSEINGKVKAINIDEGQSVEAHKVIIELEDSQEQANLEGYIAEYNKTEAYLERAKILAEKGDIPEHTLKDLEADVEVAKSKVNQAQAALNKTKLKAPFDGVIGIRKVSVGTNVAPNTPIVQLIKLNPMRIKFSVSAEKAPYVQEGNTVQTFIGNDPLPVEAKIIAKEPNINVVNNMIDVVAILDNESGIFLPGQYAKVSVVTNKEEEVVCVPEIATSSDDQENSWVFAVKDGLAIKTSIEPGIRRGEGFVEVIDGVSEGDEIILDIGDKRNFRLADGSPVIPTLDTDTAQEDE